MGALNSRGSGSSGGYGGGLAPDGSSGVAGADLPGLGPPRAFSSGSGEGYSGGGSPEGGMGGSGMGGSGLTGTGMRGNGVPGNALGGAGSSGSGTPGSSPAGTSSNGSYTDASGPGGGNGSGQARSYGTPGAGTSGTATPGTPGGGGGPTGTPIPNGVNPGTQQANGTASDAPGNGVANPGGAQGASGPSAGGPTVIGGSPSAPGSGGGTPATNARRSGDVVIFVDPLTGKPTTAPRPSPADGSPEDRPPEETEGNRAAPRVRVIAANAANRGGAAPGDEEAAAMNRFAPTPSAAAPPPRRLNAPRPAWVHGGRDWIIYVECRADTLVLYPSQRTFSLAQATGEAADNPLLKAIQQMIDRRQSSRRPGEPPYRPQVCLLVRPEFVRTFLTIYPALEALPVSKTRRNLDADDDVIGIVTGAIP